MRIADLSPNLLTCTVATHIIDNIINHIKNFVPIATQRIAIIVPPVFLKRFGHGAKKKASARNRFIVEEIDKSKKT